ncbi:MAG: hypothetical protein V1701_02790 [Planctomycetota bacterium]
MNCLLIMDIYNQVLEPLAKLLWRAEPPLTHRQFDEGCQKVLALLAALEGETK